MDKWRIWMKSHQTKLLIGLIIGQFLLVIVFLFHQSNQTEAPSPLDEWSISVESKDNPPLEESNDESEQAMWVVDIKGEVLHPGIYQVEPSMRVYDVIQMAGGLKESANTSHLNFAQHLTDQMMIYVPHEDEDVVPGPTEQTAPTEHLININTADEATLQRLNGIGEKKAQLIIQYRTENGNFHTIEELMEVSGIGQKTFDALKEQITVTN